MSQVQFPYQFVSPYSLDECATRLDAKNGDYLDTSVTVALAPVDHEMTEFTVHIERPARYRGQGAINSWLRGDLTAQEDETLVVLRDFKPTTTMRRKLFNAALAMSGLLAFVILTRTPYWMPFFGAIGMIILMVVVLSQDTESEDMVRLVEQALLYNNKPTPKKLRPSQLFFSGLLGDAPVGEKQKR